MSGDEMRCDDAGFKMGKEAKEREEEKRRLESRRECCEKRKLMGKKKFSKSKDTSIEGHIEVERRERGKEENKEKGR